MMQRRRFITLLGGAAAWPLAARAQDPAKVWRIGMLETVSSGQNAPLLSAFLQRLRQLGYADGKNFVIEYRSADGRADRFPQLVSELIQLNVDIIVLRGTPAAIAAKNATSTIPLVATAIAEPLLVVESLSHPGGNLTGLSSFQVDIAAKRVELLKETLPQAKRIAVLANMGNPPVQTDSKETEIAGQLLGVDIQVFDVRKTEDIARAFDDARRQQCDALYVSQEGFAQAHKDLIVSLAEKHRLPAIFASREYAEAGGLMSFGVDYPDLYRRAATYVDMIIKGATPADLPVQQPTRFELVVNFKTAKALGITVPPSVILRADEVIE